MELYIVLASGLFLMLALGGRADPEPPRVVYVVAEGRRGGGLLAALLGAALFVALVIFMLGALPA